MKDLNYFIKTIEKFSKKTNIPDSNIYQNLMVQQQNNSNPMASGNSQGGLGGY